MLRKLAAPLVVFAACSIVVSAQAAAPKEVTLTPSAYKVLYGHKLTLSGRLVSGLKGERVSITAWAYDKSAPVRVARVTTGAGGRYSLVVRPKIQTKYQAVVAGDTSEPVTVGVAPSVAVRQLSNGRVWTQVSGGRSFYQRFVKLQTLTSGSWMTVAQKRLSTASVAVFPTKLPTTALVRIAMSVNQAGAGYLAAASHALRYKAYSLTIDAPHTKVLYGRAITLSGRLVNGNAGQTISIEARAYGRSAPREIASVKTTAGGRWSLVVKPAIQTAYRARWGSTQSSAPFTVGVQPFVSVRELGNGDIWTQVRAGRSLAGKMVKLQQLSVAGSWLTIAQRPLNAKSATVFPVTLPNSSVRIAMSVNQAGVGLLGTMSHPLVYNGI
jgi:hypothetical protein